MTTKTSTFSFAGLELRCVTVEGQPWFVATDVCRILGRSNTTMALRIVADTEKRTFIRSECGLPAGAPLNAVNEAGLYRLVMRSDKPQAREFQTWVTGTVLPAIRKDGMYVAGEEKLDLSKDADLTKMTLAVMEALQKKAADASSPFRMNRLALSYHGLGPPLR